MKKILKYIVGMLLLITGNGAFALTDLPHPVRDTLDPLLELVNIQDRNRSTDQFWRVYKYYYEDVDTITVSDSFNLSFRHEGEKYELNIGGVVYIQDQFYKATVYKPDSTIYIENPSENLESFFQLDLFDSTLHLRYLDNISITDSAATRKITFLFKNEHPCIQYEIVYDTSTYFLKSIYYKLRKDMGTTLPSGTVVFTKYTTVKMTYKGVSFVSHPFPIRTEVYFTRQNGVFVPTTPYTNFQIIDATKK